MARHLQLHDEYWETYILDPGTEAGGPEEPKELAQRVARLETLCAEIMTRLETAEAQLAARHHEEK
ncbi:hypothetical protein ACLGIH_23805 [Streptomyces sp. HMX87]|uniref:hypothetical protein n=1 Tax=Streptomyces sp. HMX87 TaxID=3390849 RepID=UPI003A85C43B